MYFFGTINQPKYDFIFKIHVTAVFSLIDPSPLNEYIVGLYTFVGHITQHNNKDLCYFENP